MYKPTDKQHSNVIINTSTLLKLFQECRHLNNARSKVQDQGCILNTLWMQW